jgi:ABC-type multidrug transport system fused ATPase/permease subunit
MSTLRKYLSLLTLEERYKTVVIVCMIIVMALLDVCGVASIMPFIAVLVSPDVVQTNTWLNYIFEISRNMGVADVDEFLFILGVFVFLILVTSLTFKAFVTYTYTRFSSMCEYSIGKRLLRGYLDQEYSWFLGRHSADLGRIVLSEVNLVVYGGLMPFMAFLSHGLGAFFILLMLIVVDPKLAIISGAIILVAYALILNRTREISGRIGAERVIANQSRFSAVNEAFSASKEIKVGGLERFYVSRFSGPALKFAELQAIAQSISQLPRYLIEVVAFGGMLIVILYLMSQKGTLTQVLPLLGVYAFAGYRLIPAFQQIYSSLTNLRVIGPALDKLHAELTSIETKKPASSFGQVAFKRDITLSQINYCYPNTSSMVLENFNLTIPCGSTVALVGATGSGKTTTIELILGLLRAQEGKVMIDGQTLTEQNQRAWQSNIGYVPQHIYLTDDTLASNIAFGLEEIDLAAVERAAKIACLHDFVAEELPEKYETKLGERGVRLSGGQRQRIGIARALYRSPRVLVLDEATSALDNLTEASVMASLNSLATGTTIILVAHRLTSVKLCDIVFLLDRGGVAASGTFENLFENNELFKKMVRSR